LRDGPDIPIVFEQGIRPWFPRADETELAPPPLAVIEGADRHHGGAARKGTLADTQTILTSNRADIRQQDSFVLFGRLLSAERLLFVFFGFCMGFSSHLCRAIGAPLGCYRELRGVELTAQVVIRCNATSPTPARLALRSCACSASTRPGLTTIEWFKTNDIVSIFTLEGISRSSP
jgi:hypothetical protein